MPRRWPQPVPLLEGARALVQGNIPGGGRTNRQHFGQRVVIAPGVPADLVDLLFDPQTSGGLLFAIAPEAMPQARLALDDAGVAAVVIGRVTAPGTALIFVG
jgi:selenide,water dikinase